MMIITKTTTTVTATTPRVTVITIMAIMIKIIMTDNMMTKRIMLVMMIRRRAGNANEAITDKEEYVNNIHSRGIFWIHDLCSHRTPRKWHIYSLDTFHSMTTSSNENIFRVTGPLWGEFTGHRLILLTQWRGALMFSLIWAWTNG